MRLKITAGFLVIAAIFLTYLFRDQLITKKSDATGANAGAAAAIPDYLSSLADLNLRSYGGDPVKLNAKELKQNEKLVVHFWASWCEPCVNEVPELIEYSRHNPQVRFIIVSVDDYTEDIKKFLKSFPEFGADQYIKIWDAEKQVSKIFNVDRLPMSVIFRGETAEPQFIKSVVDWKSFK